MDIKISKVEGGLSTEVYRKPTHTGLGLSWFSFCPEIFKVNLIKTLLDRAYEICSNYLLLHKEICNLRMYFTSNNYKEDYFDSILKTFLYSKRKQNPVKSNVPKLIKYIKMPFYGHISYEFRKLILNTLKNSFPAVEFRVTFTNDFKVGSFFNFKDRVPEPLCSNIVYKFTCPSCQARYLGCTSRSFKIRIFEHMGKSHRTGNFLQKMSFSTIRNHSHEQDHPFTERDFEIVARFRGPGEALLGEKLLIKRDNPELNLANNC